MNSAQADRSLVLFARHAHDEAERRGERAADAVLVAMMAWAHMREARRRLLDHRSINHDHSNRQTAEPERER